MNQISKSSETLSAINIPFSQNSAYFMALTVHIKNNGSASLSCQPISAIPNAFDVSLNKNIKTIGPNQEKEWTTNLINISQFLGLSQPITFSINVSCNSIGIKGIISNSTSSGSTNLSIHSVCGDGFCGPDETLKIL